MKLTRLWPPLRLRRGTVDLHYMSHPFPWRRCPLTEHAVPLGTKWGRPHPKRELVCQGLEGLIGASYRCESRLSIIFTSVILLERNLERPQEWDEEDVEFTQAAGC